MKTISPSGIAIAIVTATGPAGAMPVHPAVLDDQSLFNRCGRMGLSGVAHLFGDMTGSGSTASGIHQALDPARDA